MKENQQRIEHSFKLEPSINLQRICEGACIYFIRDYDESKVVSYTFVLTLIFSTPKGPTMQKKCLRHRIECGFLIVMHMDILLMREMHVN